MKKGTLYYVLASVALVIALIVGTGGSSDDQINESTINTIDVTTVIQVGDNATEYPQVVDDATTALGALEHLERDGEIELEITDYDFGSIVDSIDGVGDDTTDNKFWIYYINDATAEVGASSYVLADGDRILWSYEASIN